MIRFIKYSDLHLFPQLADSMFRDRATQFHDRLGWEVDVDARGWERDQYDALDPLYMIYELEDGTHGGSTRFLPTTGRTMINEHFTHLTDGVEITSATIWEASRFVVSPRLTGSARQTFRATGAIFLGGAELGLAMGLTFFVGVADAATLKVYNKLGWGPEEFGSGGEGRDRIAVGLWEISEEMRDRVARLTHLGPQIREAVDAIATASAFPTRAAPEFKAASVYAGYAAQSGAIAA